MLLLCVITVVVFSTLVKLGFWQLERGNSKQQAEAMLAQRELAQPVALTTLQLNYTYLDRDAFYGLQVSAEVKPTNLPTVLLDNQTHEGKVGYLVLQPMLVASSEHSNDNSVVLIDLGFVEGSARRSELPEFQTLTTAQTLQGKLYLKSSNQLSEQAHLELMVTDSGKDALRVQSINPQLLSRTWDVPVAEILWQPSSLQSWPQPMVWKPFPLASAKHFGYSVQWFAMALVFLSLMIGIAFKYIKRS